MKTFIMTVLALAAFGTAPAAAKDPVVGKAAPAFTLPSVDGKKVSLKDYRGKFVVLEWINHGCPYVVKHYDSGNMPALQKEITGRDVIWLSVASSAEGKQGYYTAEEWKPLNAQKKSAATAVLLDYDGKTGRAYGAATTPHMFVVDPKGRLVYKGAIDDKPTTKQEDVQGAKNYVRQALDEALAGKPVSVSATKPYGCSVKYK